MRFRGITEENDWLFGNGKQSYLVNEGAIEADIKTTLQTFFQECFYDPTVGIPWFNILGQKDQNLLVLTLKNALDQVDGVTKVFDVRYYIDENRNANVSYLVNTIYTIQTAGTVQL